MIIRALRFCGCVRISKTQKRLERPLAKSLSKYPALLRPAAKPDACVVGEKTFSTWRKPRLRAFLACRLGLELFARPHNDPVIRISSNSNPWYYLMILVKTYYVYNYQRLIPARCYAARTSPDAEGR